MLVFGSMMPAKQEFFLDAIGLIFYGKFKTFIENLTKY